MKKKVEGWKKRLPKMSTRLNTVRFKTKTKHGERKHGDRGCGLLVVWGIRTN